MDACSYTAFSGTDDPAGPLSRANPLGDPDFINRALSEHNPAFEYLELDHQQDICGVLPDDAAYNKGEAIKAVKKLFFAEDENGDPYGDKVIPAGQYRERDGDAPALMKGNEANMAFLNDNTLTAADYIDQVNNNMVRPLDLFIDHIDMLDVVFEAN